MKAFQFCNIANFFILCLFTPTVVLSVPAQSSKVQPQSILKGKLYTGGKTGDGFAFQSLGQSMGVNTEEWILKFSDTVGRSIQGHPPYFQALYKFQGIQFDIYQIEASLIDQNLLNELVARSSLIEKAQILVDTIDSSVRLFIKPTQSAQFSITEVSTNSSILIKIVGERSQ